MPYPRLFVPDSTGLVAIFESGSVRLTFFLFFCDLGLLYYLLQSCCSIVIVFLTSIFRFTLKLAMDTFAFIRASSIAWILPATIPAFFLKK